MHQEVLGVNIISFCSLLGPLLEIGIILKANRIITTMLYILFLITLYIMSCVAHIRLYHIILNDIRYHISHTSIKHVIYGRYITYITLCNNRHILHKICVSYQSIAGHIQLLHMHYNMMYTVWYIPKIIYHITEHTVCYIYFT
jgi:hypothetical protein